MKKLRFLLPFALILFFAASCGVSPHTRAYVYEPANPAMPGDDESYGLVTAERRVILDGSLQLEVRDVDSTVDALVELALRNDGYVVRSTNQQTTIRVAAVNFKTAMDEIKTYGTLISQSLTGSDVTDDHYDLELRLENAEKSRGRYLELLAAATTVEETLRVERELERLNGLIDTIKGQLKKMNHLEEYATLTVAHQQIDEKAKPGLISYVGIGVWKGVRWLFVRK